MRFILALVACFAVPAFSAEPIKTFGDETELCACWKDKAACVKYDKPDELALAFLELHEFGTSSVETEEWTACDNARCYGTEAEVAKACPAEWVVADNKIPLKTTQPLKACDDKCLKDRKLGKGLGRSGHELTTPCEGPLEPPWLNGANQYQFTTGEQGRGIAPCEKAE